MRTELSASQLTPSYVVFHSNITVMLNKLIRGSVGFPQGVRAAAFLMLGCFALGNLLMRQPKTPIDSTERSAPEKADAPGDVVEESPERFWDFTFSLILLAAFLASLGSYFPVYYVQQFADFHGVDKNLSFYSIAILNAANMIGRIVPNYIADKVGTWSVFTTLIVLNGNT